MSETINDCKSCGATSSVKRLISKNFHIKKANSSPFNRKEKKPGSIVKKFIQDAKEELSTEKESLSKKVYTEE